MSKKKHYWLLALDIISCVFFLGWIWYSFKNNSDTWTKVTWIVFEAICLFNTITEARKISILNRTVL